MSSIIIIQLSVLFAAQTNGPALNCRQVPMQ